MAAEEIAADYAETLPALAACGACSGTGRLLGDICPDWGGLPPRIPSVEEQIALIGSADANEYITILDVGLPSGEIIQRHTGDGVPNDWITVSRGDVEIDVQASGIVGVVLGGEQIDNVSLQELDDLRALLTLDRKQLCHIADLGPEITEAIEVWYDMPWDECKRIARTVGFAAWLRDPNHARACQPKPPTPPATPAAAPRPTTTYEIDPEIGRYGYMLTGLTFLMKTLDPDRADRLTALLTHLGDIRRDSAERDRLVDALLAVRTESITSVVKKAA